ncbi:UV radiation resistance protein/autophagy-related protein 14 [Flagelloscypha sp. PMI_526]|nr:UV radiation resistance protein/autophagy-related protein 14 [Flagelloscypha sp. PMI_526]
MECVNCELVKRQFYCEKCVGNHFRNLRRQIQHFSSERDDQVSKAKKSLESYVEPARIRRAALSDAQSRLEEIQVALAKLRKDNERKREKLRILREDIAARRQSLSAAHLLIPPSHATPQTSDLASVTSSLRVLSTAITQARQGLISELVEVFNIVQVGGRPPIGGKAGTKGEWTIGDLILPVPGDMRRYPPDHINSVLTHTIHFVGLLAFYLGIKLPFEVVWASNQPPSPSAYGSAPSLPAGKLGVGQPWIGATRGIGSEYGGWARNYVKHPLHLTSNPGSPTPLSSLVSPLNPEDSVLLSPDATASANPNFPTALAMLIYNVSYLGYTQNIDITLSQAGDVLSNLWSICCSNTHTPRNTHLLYPPPTPASFQLDFSQLLQATTVNPRTASVGLKSAGSTPSVGRIQRLSSAKDKIPEEDDGWDLVEDGFG